MWSYAIVTVDSLGGETRLLFTKVLQAHGQRSTTEELATARLRGRMTS